MPNSFRPIVPLKDESPDVNPTGATFNSPTILVGQPGSPFQREVVLQTNETDTFRTFIWRARNALAIPASITGILGDTLIHVGAGGLLCQVYGVLYLGGAVLPALALLAFFSVLYIAIWTTILKMCPELWGGFWWRIFLILIGCILVVV